MTWLTFHEKSPEINSKILVRRSLSFHRSMSDYHIFEIEFKDDILKDDMITHWWNGNADIDKAIKKWENQ